MKEFKLKSTIIVSDVNSLYPSSMLKKLSYAYLRKANLNRKKDRNDFESYDEFFLKNDFENDEYAHFIHATFKLPKDAKESEIDNYVFTNPIVTKKTIPHEFLSSYVIQANKKEFCMKQ